ncbi:GapS4a family protein [Marinifilum fragile]
MGEFPKRIGEIGEEIVGEFLSLIGWHNPAKNFDIPSIDPEKHKKKTHGIDAYFNYKSPLISKTLENIIISVKYSKDKYPNSPVAKFKDYYVDLGKAIESFKKSDLRADNIINRTDIEGVFDRGVLFWLNNVDGDSTDLTSKLSRLEAPKDFNHDGIFLVDNNKIEFIFSVIEFVKKVFVNKEIEFTYFNTGLNGDNDTLKNGTIMPVQYLASNIIPIRIQIEEEKNALVLCSREKFEQDELIKLIGLAKNITANYQAKTIIAFPDYDRVYHEQLVNNAIRIFEEDSFTKTITVLNFNQNFRN